MDRWLVLGTWALVVVTLFVAFQQAWILRKDLRVKLQLRFAERFDALTAARGDLARILQAGTSRDEISEDVMNFFEDVGMYLDTRYLDKRLVWRTFGFFAVRWWSACKDYILQERRTQNDPTLFADFEKLAKQMRTMDIDEGLGEPTSIDIQKFLADETEM